MLCTNCNSWQNWRRYISISNTFLALLIALISVLTLAGSKFVDLYNGVFPDREVNISGYFDKRNRKIVLNVYNFGNVPANLASNIQCVFGLENALGNSMTNEGTEIEYWTGAEKIVLAGKSLLIEYDPQIPKFDAGDQQILCFSALNYLDRGNKVENYFMAIIPNLDHIWWPIETHFTTEDEIQSIYPRELNFQQ